MVDRLDRAESRLAEARQVIAAAKDIRSSIFADDIDIDIVSTFDAALKRLEGKP
jgi:hypothetical protein